MRDGGVPKAVKEAKRIRQQYPWALKSDISAFFDRIDRVRLADGLAKILKRSSISPVLRQAIDCEIDESQPWVSGWMREAAIERGVGLRQGMPLSPLLSNFVLKKFDRHFELKQTKLVRYADDFVIFAKSESECRDFFTEARAILLELGHDIPNPGVNSKTMISSPDAPIEFLGYEISKRPTAGYQIVVPRHAFDSIKATLSKYHDLDAAIAKFKTLDRMMQSLGSIARSFAAVYNLGFNHADLESHVDNCRGRAVTKIADQLFGSDVLRRMDDRKKAFLGLTLLPLESEW